MDLNQRVPAVGRLAPHQTSLRPVWVQGSQGHGKVCQQTGIMVLGQAERGRGHTVGDVPALLAPVLLLRARLPTELGAAWLFGLHLHTQGSLAGAP